MSKLNKMRRRLVVPVALPVVLAASLAAGQAMAAATVTVVDDTETALSVVWSGTLGDFASLAVPDPVHWDLLGFYSLVTSKTIFANTTSVWEAAVQARHAVPDPGPYPHAGETRFGPTYTAYLGGSMGAGGYDSKMGDHNTDQMLAPANWVTPHWDHYGLQVSTHLDGTGTVTLTALHPVPEPSTYAMLLAGLAAVGSMARRRSARP